MCLPLPPLNEAQSLPLTFAKPRLSANEDPEARDEPKRSRVWQAEAEIVPSDGDARRGVDVAWQGCEEDFERRVL